MACEECKGVQSIPECVESLVIGSISNLDTPVYIFVKNLTTGYIHRQEAESSAEGVVILDCTDPDISYYNQNHFYHLWITLQTEGPDDRLEITIEGDEVEHACLLLSYKKIIPSAYETYTILA